MTPILQSYLFTNSSNEPDLIGELKREIQSSDSIVCWNIYIEENRAYNINNKNCIFINDKWKNYLAFSNKKIDIIEDIKLNLLREF